MKCCSVTCSEPVKTVKFDRFFQSCVDPADVQRQSPIDEHPQVVITFKRQFLPTFIIECAAELKSEKAVVACLVRTIGRGVCIIETPTIYGKKIRFVENMITVSFWNKREVDVHDFVYTWSIMEPLIEGDFVRDAWATFPHRFLKIIEVLFHQSWDNFIVSIKIVPLVLPPFVEVRVQARLVFFERLEIADSGCHDQVFFCGHTVAIT